MAHGVPRYYRLVRNARGWSIELIDNEIRAMGLASKHGQALVFESEAQAETAARKRKLEVLPHAFRL